MSLVGNLEDLGLGDILQIVSLSRKSGVLNLSWGEVRGKIVFRDGQVVGAFSTAGKRTLPAILADHNVVPHAKVEAMDRAVNAMPDARHVKEALVKDFRVKPEAVDDAIREQTESAVFHFFAWPEGAFNFELQEIEGELSALEPPDHAFVLELGLSPQFLAMEGARLHDERRRGRFEAPVGPPLRSGKAAEPVPPEPLRAQPRSQPRRREEPPAPPRPVEAEYDFSSVEDALAFYDWQAKAAPPPPPEPFPPPEPPRERPRPAGPAPRVVVVDDDDLMLESLVHHLAPKGYQLRTFNATRPALAHLQELVDQGEKPAAVVIDLLMPNATGASTLGGLELLGQVRSIHSGIAVYLMSDYENAPGRKRAEELGARFFFMKPKSSQLDEDFNSPELINFVAVLENALSSEPKTAAPPTMKGDLVNLGEELRREFGEEMTPGKPETEAVKPSRGLGMLKAMIGELNDPASSGQITLLILRFAAELMNRAAIFLVAKTQIAGLGQFGLNLDGLNPQRHVRQIRIPLNAPSIFREAIQKRMPLKKPLKSTPWNDYLVRNLGGLPPREVFVAPIIAGGKIAAILYGDNAPEEREIGDTDSLEIFLAQAGLAMEKALLERRLREMESPTEGSG